MSEPKSTPTDPTDATVSVTEHLDLLYDGISVANRIARRNREEIARLRFTVLFAMSIALMFYITRGRVQ